MAWVVVAPDSVALGGQGITETTTTQRHPVGMIVQAVDPTYGAGEFIYLKGVSSTAVGSWVSYTNAGVTTLAAANVIGSLAIAMAANTTTTSYGWYQISGVARGLGLTLITGTAAQCYLSGTAGSIDDASIAGDVVYNAKKVGPVHVVGTFLDTYNISRPFAANRVSIIS